MYNAGEGTYTKMARRHKRYIEFDTSENLVGVGCTTDTKLG